MDAATFRPRNSTTDRTQLDRMTAPLWFRASARSLSAFAPGWAAAAAERAFLTPMRFGSPARERGWGTAAESRTVLSPAGPLAAWRWGGADPGGGRTVVLVHGWAGRGLQLGAFAEPLVAQGFSVLAFDAPGHGASPGRRSSLVAMIAAVESAVESVGGRVAGLVGHSLGAVAAIAAAARSQDRIGRLVTVCASGDLAAVGPRFAAATGFTPGVISAMRRRIEARLGVPWTDLEPLRLAPRMTVPLLALHDRDDAEIPWQESAALAEAWPGARLALTEGLGHNRVLRAPEVVTAAAGFLAGERAAAA